MSGRGGAGEGMAGGITAGGWGMGEGGVGRIECSVCLSPSQETVRACSQDHAELGGRERDKTVL